MPHLERRGQLARLSRCPDPQREGDRLFSLCAVKRCPAVAAKGQRPMIATFGQLAVKFEIARQKGEIFFGDQSPPAESSAAIDLTICAVTDDDLFRINHSFIGDGTT